MFRVLFFLVIFIYKLRFCYGRIKWKKKKMKNNKIEMKMNEQKYF